MGIKNYIEDLFRYLETYENNYASFETEAFQQTYQGIIAVFQALRQQRDDAVMVDYEFLDNVKASPLTSSDLRQLTVQILITYFESEADTDGRSNSSYAYCRGLRAIKQDIPFFEKHLVPMLFEEGSLNNNHRLRGFILDEMARYMNKFGSKLQPNRSPENFQAMSVPLRMLELARRRMDIGTNLITDRTTLEFHLQRIDYFNKIGTKHRICDAFFRDWQYLKTTSFWDKVKGVFSEVGSKFKGAFSSFGYFRLTITQRNPAYLFYGVLIVLFILVAIYVPIKWQTYANDELQDIQQRTEELQAGQGN